MPAQSTPPPASSRLGLFHFHLVSSFKSSGSKGEGQGNRITSNMPQQNRDENPQQSLLKNHVQQRDVDVEDPVKDDRIKGPDSSYSWAIFAAIFWIYFLTGGIIRSSGVIYTHLLFMFHFERDKAAWPSSVATFFLCTVCPLAVVLSKSLTNRVLAVAGCFIASLAFIVCYACTTVATITLVLGVMFGISMGIIAYVPALVVSDYFDRYQEIVYAAVSISAPIGGMVLPPLAELIISAAGLHKFLLYFGCLLLTTVGAGYMFTKPPWQEDTEEWQNKKNQGVQTVNSKNIVESDFKEDEGGKEADIEESDLEKHKLADQSIETMGRSSEFYNTCPEYPNTNYSIEYYDCLPTNSEAAAASTSMIPNGRAPRGSVVSFAEQTGSYQNGHGQKLADRSTDKAGGNRKESGAEAQEQPMFQQLKLTITEIGVNPMFWLITLSQMVFMWVFEIYLLVIVDYCIELDMNPQGASFVLSLCSMADIIARLTAGNLSSVAKRKNINLISAFFMGAFCTLAVVKANIYLAIVLSAFFGLFAGIFGASCVLAYADYIGIDKFSFVLGVAQFISGIPHLFRPLVIGAFSSYNGLLYMNGAFGMVCGLLWLLEPLIMRNQRTYERH